MNITWEKIKRAGIVIGIVVGIVSCIATLFGVLFPTPVFNTPSATPTIQTLPKTNTTQSATQKLEYFVTFISNLDEPLKLGVNGKFGELPAQGSLRIKLDTTELQSIPIYYWNENHNEWIVVIRVEFDLNQNTVIDCDFVSIYEAGFNGNPYQCKPREK